jgi:hypothetical protein
MMLMVFRYNSTYDYRPTRYGIEVQKALRLGAKLCTVVHLPVTLRTVPEH